MQPITKEWLKEIAFSFGSEKKTPFYVGDLLSCARACVEWREYLQTSNDDHDTLFIVDAIRSGQGPEEGETK